MKARTLASVSLVLGLMVGQSPAGPPPARLFSFAPAEDDDSNEVFYSPAEVHAAALADLRTVDPGRQPFTRYVSFHAVPPSQRAAAFKSIIFAMNSTSFRQILASPTLLYGGVLARIDLGDYGWDSATRAARIKRLAAQGVDTSFAKPDFWEELAKADPYWFTNAYRADGSLARGWLDPVADEEIRQRTRASKAVLRADWLLAKILLDDTEASDGAPFGKGGFYSQALLLPPSERDLYKAFGINEKLVDADSQLRAGGAVTKSIVGKYNREVQVIPSAYGWDAKFIWRTFDVAKDASGGKSVFEAFAGKLNFDGREAIGTLPNGLHWYYLSNNKGAQVGFVPQTIAEDGRKSSPTREKTVSNAKMCISCHGPDNGVIPFEDEVGPAVLDRKNGVGLAVIAKSRERFEELSQEIVDYYLTDANKRADRQRESYAARLMACNGESGAANSLNVVGLIERYYYDLVTPRQAAREMGLSVAEATLLWRNSGGKQTPLLARGKSIRRGSWEFPGFLESMTADSYRRRAR